MQKQKGILILEHGGETHKFPLYEGENSIGRNHLKNKITIRDKSISDVHAKLICRKGLLWVVDCASKNGVFVGN